MGIRTHRRTLAITLAASLLMFSLPTAALAGGVTFQGRVVAEDGATPVEGVVIRIALKETGTIYDSNPSATDGGFQVDAVPEGEYEVLAQYGDVGYLTAESIHLEEGKNRSASIVIQTAPASTTASTLPLWGIIAIVSTIAVIIWAVFDKTTFEGDDSISPFGQD